MASILRMMRSVAPHGINTWPSPIVRKNQPPCVERRLRVLDAAHAEPEPRQHLLQVETRAGGGEHVAVAGRVDDDVGEDRAAPRLALHGRRRSRAIALAQRLAAPRRAAGGARRSLRPSRSARSASPPDRRRPSSARDAAPIPRPGPSGGASRPAPDRAIPTPPPAEANAPPRRAMRSTISWQRPAMTCSPAPSSSVSSRTIKPPVARPPSAP